MPLAPGGLCRWQAYLIMHPAAFKCTDKNLSLVYKICSSAADKFELGNMIHKKHKEKNAVLKVN